jgi:FkbM family methyltransferase
MSSYTFGLGVVRVLFRLPVVPSAATVFSRIWMRHSRWTSHLRNFQFDGVIDGGANIGEFAQVVRDALPNAHLLCIEPHPECAAHLRKRGFEVVQAALWKEQGKLQLFQSGPTTVSSVVRAEGNSVGDVDAVRLCDLPIRGQRLLIKLDLQGAEAEALEGLGDLESRCAAFLVEVALPPANEFQKFDEFFSSRGFVQFGSVNELFYGDKQVEADIIWVKRELLP